MTVENVQSESVVKSDSLKADILDALELIRPALQSDGGDIKFVEIDVNSIVHVELVGACGSCAASLSTLKAGVELILMDKVPGIKGVVNVGEITPKDACPGSISC